MKKYIELVIAMSLFIINPVAALDMVEITYPTYLPHSQKEVKITIRKLPFAVRGGHPEYIGAGLSIAYVVPHIDYIDLPKQTKNINLISACGIKVTTTRNDNVKKKQVKPVESRAAISMMPVTLHIDLSKMTKPDYVPFELKEIIEATVKAIKATLKHRNCKVVKLVVTSVPGQEKFKKMITSSITQE